MTVSLLRCNVTRTQEGCYQAPTLDALVGRASASTNAVAHRSSTRELEFAVLDELRSGVSEQRLALDDGFRDPAATRDLI